LLLALVRCPVMGAGQIGYMPSSHADHLGLRGSGGKGGRRRYVTERGRSELGIAASVAFAPRVGSGEIAATHPGVPSESYLSDDTP
jgi:hypothetical protein